MTIGDDIRRYTVEPLRDPVHQVYRHEAERSEPRTERPDTGAFWFAFVSRFHR
jgi:hypothetical protein